MNKHLCFSRSLLPVDYSAYLLSFYFPTSSLSGLYSCKICEMTFFPLPALTLPLFSFSCCPELHLVPRNRGESRREKRGWHICLMCIQYAGLHIMPAIFFFSIVLARRRPDSFLIQIGDNYSSCNPTPTSLIIYLCLW